MADRGRVGYGSDTRDLLCQHQEEYMSVQTGSASGEYKTMLESLKKKYEVTRMKDTALKEKDKEGRMLSSSVNEKRERTTPGLRRQLEARYAARMFLLCA